MHEPIHIAFYSDLHCPYAYLSAYRLRTLRDEYQDKIAIDYKCLALEYMNKRPTPKIILDSETPFLMQEEPDIPYQPWHRDLTTWPVTMWPAFEAVKCAELQSWQLAAEMDWVIRVAFFHDSKCISMRSVLLELAEQVEGLDIQRFTDDLDRGVTKYLVLQESQEGWEQLKVPSSPTLVLPDGRLLDHFALPAVELDGHQFFRVRSIVPAQLNRQSALDLYRDLFQSLLPQS
jgi:predicted DsbA family dithiol-disulfide isomerase